MHFAWHKCDGVFEYSNDPQTNTLPYDLTQKWYVKDNSFISPSLLRSGTALSFYQTFIRFCSSLFLDILDAGTIAFYRHVSRCLERTYFSFKLFLLIAFQPCVLLPLVSIVLFAFYLFCNRIDHYCGFHFV